MSRIDAFWKPNPTAIALWLAAALLLAVPGTFAQTKMTGDFPELSEGHELVQQREWEDAEEWFYEYVEDHPKHAGALRALAFVELRRPGGDAVRAKRYIERSLEQDPDHAIGMFIAGKAYEALDQEEKAAKQYDEMIEFGPGKDDPRRAAAVHLARFARGLLASAQKDYDKAKTLFEEVLGRSPQHAYATYEMGLIAAKQGNTEQAIEWLRKTINNVNFWAPSESWPYPGGRYGYIRENARYELGKQLLKAGKPQEALEAIEPAASMAERRNEYSSRGQRKPPKSPLQGEADARFENAPFYKAEALAALGETEQAKDLFRAFSRFDVGSQDYHGKARDRYRELR